MGVKAVGVMVKKEGLRGSSVDHGLVVQDYECMI